MTSESINTPTIPTQRIVSLDILRGFAVLGILIMNIQSFSMISAAYSNPTAYGDFTGFNQWIWILSHIFADQKFLSIFSMLFGAGIVMMSERMQQKGQKAVSLHYRRNLILIIFGLMHAYLFWYGDILVTYGLCALVAFWFRNKAAKFLLITGIIIFSVTTFIYIFFATSYYLWDPVEQYEFLLRWQPEPDLINEEINFYLSSFLEQIPYRMSKAIELQTTIFIYCLGWRALGLMLVGMALYKWQILTAQRTQAFYYKLLFSCLSIGLVLILIGLILHFKNHWRVEYSMIIGGQFNYWGSLFMALAYIAMIMLFCRSSVMIKLKERLTSVGKMAFSNYLMQTLICTFIFYGHGLALFGEVERLGQIAIVIAVWLLQIFLSQLWLKHFRFGPMEWLWRSLSYLKPQPLLF